VLQSLPPHRTNQPAHPTIEGDRTTKEIEPRRRSNHEQPYAIQSTARRHDHRREQWHWLCHCQQARSVGGKFIVDGKEKRSSDESYDQTKAQRLWELSWRWCGLDESGPA
jgi:hypothetical protein